MIILIYIHREQFYARRSQWFYMNTYNLHYAIDNSVDQVPGMGRSLLQVYTGEPISETEAEKLLRRIADHKWYVSEKLDRDVGFHVAAIDYVENFYERQPAQSSLSLLLSKSSRAIKTVVLKYLTAKGNTLPI